MNDPSPEVTAPDRLDDDARRQCRLFSEVQEVAHIGVWEWQVGADRVTWSPELYRIYGLSPQEYAPTFEGYLQRVDPRDRERVRTTVEHIFADQRSFSQNERILRPDGSIRRLHTWGHALVDDHGNVARLIGVCQDVTEQTVAEEQRNQSESRYRLLVENAAEGIWLGDEQGRTLFTNAKMADMLGYTPDEMKGRSVFAFMDQHQRSVAKVHLNRRRQGEETHFGLSLRHKSGSRVWTTAAASPMYGPDGRFVGVQAIIDDVTRKRQSEVLLAAQRDIFDLLATGDSLTDALNILVRAIESLSEGVIGSVLLLDEQRQCLLTGAAPNLPDAFSRAIEGAPIGPNAGSCGTAAYRGELVVVDDIQTDPLWADYRDLAMAHRLRACWSSPIFSKDLKVLGTFAMYFREVRRPSAADIQLVMNAAGAAALAIQHVRMRKSLVTAVRARDALLEQERNARSEVQKALHVREEFLSAASHELRTPLTPLKMQAQVLARMVTDGDPQRLVTSCELRTLAEGVCRQVSKLLKVAEDVLNVARMGAGELKLTRETCNLAAIVREVAERFGEDAEKARCMVQIHADTSVIGEWDREQIERVVVNLFTNAIKFGAGKPIEISVTWHDSEACLQVKDAGIGIAQDDQGKLFKRFERIAPLTHFGGFGLGLYIAREIVNAHGGTIQVTSALGQGACFVVHLPAH
jgi:PAS domain S-box-containing protein